MNVFNGRRKTLALGATLIVAAIALTALCGVAFSHSTGPAEVFTIPGCGNGDAKFFGDGIITSIGGQLTLLDLSGQVVKRYDVYSNWIDCIDDESIIIYGNFNCETGLVKLDRNREPVEHNLIFQGGTLNIDPTITKIDGRYYVTVTELVGNVNNASAEAENGVYTIRMFVSDDCAQWEPLSEIAREQANLEDVDIRFSDGVLYACYEQEVLDKGDSAIVVRYSEDLGKTWSAPITLLEPDCDHEPVSLIPDSEGFTLLYSCDLEDRGGSYMSGKIYSARFNRDLKCVEKDINIKTHTTEGILWYDYVETGDSAYYLFAGNYNTGNDMIVEKRALDRAGAKG